MGLLEKVIIAILIVILIGLVVLDSDIIVYISYNSIHEYERGMKSVLLLLVFYDLDQNF